MSSTSVFTRGRVPLHVVQLLGSGSAGTGGHVRSLTAGLVARGLRVTVCAPAAAEARYAFARAGARFVALPTGPGPALCTLRSAGAGADLVHAHGMRPGLLAAFALLRSPAPLVVSWHGRPAPPGPGARLRRVPERRVARAASVLLAATPDLLDQARRHGARDARLAPLALPVARRPGAGRGTREAGPQKIRAELGVVDRPLLVTAAPLTRGEDGEGLGHLLTAARGWREASPQPVLAVLGDGPEKAALRRRVEREELPVRLAAPGADLRALLAAADVAVLAPRWDAGSPLLQAALRGGVPLVATAVGGVPGLVGDAAVLVPYGEPDTLTEAVLSLLRDPERRAVLSGAGQLRARSWPTEDTTVAQVLSVYDELTGVS